MTEENKADGNVGMTWEQAVEEAREQHSDLRETEEAPETEETALETDQEDETQSASTEDPDSEAEDQESETEAASDEGDELLTKEELAELRKEQPALAKLIDNLEGWRADLTKKSQSISDERKQVEPLLPWIQRLQEDPRGTLLELAGHYNVDLNEAEETEEEEEGPSLEEAAVKELKEALADPELEFLAERMGKPVVGLAERIARQIVEEELKPLRNFQEQALSKEAHSEISAAQEKFAEKYPDYKDYEPQMVEVIKKLALDKDGQPRDLNMSQYDLLETAYTLATKDKKTASDARRLIERQTKAAKKAGSPKSGVPPKNVKEELPDGASFDECARAAKALVKKAG